MKCYIIFFLEVIVFSFLACMDQQLTVAPFFGNSYVRVIPKPLDTTQFATPFPLAVYEGEFLGNDLIKLHKPVGVFGFDNIFSSADFQFCPDSSKPSLLSYEDYLQKLEQIGYSTDGCLLSRCIWRIVERSSLSDLEFYEKPKKIIFSFEECLLLDLFFLQNGFEKEVGKLAEEKLKLKNEKMSIDQEHLQRQIAVDYLLLFSEKLKSAVSNSSPFLLYQLKNSFEKRIIKDGKLSNVLEKAGIAYSGRIPKEHWAMIGVLLNGADPGIFDCLSNFQNTSESLFASSSGMGMLKSKEPSDFVGFTDLKTRTNVIFTNG